MQAPFFTFPKAGAVFYKEIVRIPPRSMASLKRLFLALLAGLLALPALVRADDDQSINNARSLAHTWLAEIDSGNYDQSYAEGGQALHDKVPQETWVKILRTERPSLGKVVNRQEVAHVLHSDGLEGVTGTFLVLTYHTDFAAKSDEVEYVVVRHEFGGWRCVGYDFGPANPDASDGDDTPATTTKSDETLVPPTPTNGMVVPAKRDN
jgi:hypothetical protein